jgi:hypothetical protein
VQFRIDQPYAYTINVYLSGGRSSVGLTGEDGRRWPGSGGDDRAAVWMAQRRWPRWGWPRQGWRWRWPTTATAVGTGSGYGRWGLARRVFEK